MFLYVVTSFVSWMRSILQREVFDSCWSHIQSWVTSTEETREMKCLIWRSDQIWQVMNFDAHWWISTISCVCYALRDKDIVTVTRHSTVVSRNCHRGSQDTLCTSAYWILTYRSIRNRKEYDYESDRDVGSTSLEDHQLPRTRVRGTSNRLPRRSRRMSSAQRQWLGWRVWVLPVDHVCNRETREPIRAQRLAHFWLS